MTTYSAPPAHNTTTTAYTRQYAFRQVPTLPLQGTTMQGAIQLILPTATSIKLQEGRDSRLYSMLLQEFEQKQSYFPDVTKDDVVALATKLIVAVRPLGLKTIVLGLTYDQSLSLRTGLCNGIDTLYVEVAVGPDADVEEDTFVSLRRDGAERWGTSGALHALLPRLAELQELTASR
jgi:hypothetical protein